MTINRKLAARIEWKCDQCGKIGIWGTGWWAGGSYFLEEAAPDQVPTLCSDQCKFLFESRVKNGEVKIPEVKLLKSGAIRLTKRKGY